MALFPEGTTGDRARLDRVRTGAARIALGAVENGVADLHVVAVGLAYENRMGWRSRVMVEVGEPFQLGIDAERLLPVGSHAAESDHAAVEAVTEEIEARLRAVSPDYVDVAERESLRLAAHVAVLDDTGEPHFACIETTARTLARAGEDKRSAIVRALADYMLSLRFAGLTDRDVAAGTPRGPFLRAALVAAVAVALFPVVIIGVTANIIPVLIVRSASRRAEAVVTKGTVRLVTGLIVFPLTWVVISILVAGTALEALAVVTLLAVAGLITIWLAEKACETVGDLLVAIRRSDRRSLMADLRAERAALVDLVNRVESDPNESQIH